MLLLTIKSYNPGQKCWDYKQFPPSPYSMLVYWDKSQNFWTFQQNNSLSGTNIEWGEGGSYFFSWYRVFAVFLKKCLSSDNYRRTSQLLLTRIVDINYIRLLHPSDLQLWGKAGRRLFISKTEGKSVRLLKEHSNHQSAGPHFLKATNILLCHKRQALVPS